MAATAPCLSVFQRVQQLYADLEQSSKSGAMAYPAVSKDSSKTSMGTRILQPKLAVALKIASASPVRRITSSSVRRSMSGPPLLRPAALLLQSLSTKFCLDVGGTQQGPLAGVPISRLCHTQVIGGESIDDTRYIAERLGRVISRELKLIKSEMAIKGEDGDVQRSVPLPSVLPLEAELFVANLDIKAAGIDIPFILQKAVEMSAREALEHSLPLIKPQLIDLSAEEFELLSMCVKDAVKLGIEDSVLNFKHGRKNEDDVTYKEEIYPGRGFVEPNGIKKDEMEFFCKCIRELSVMVFKITTQK